jgi:lipopolysaccharide/colanic/teichoic acid biosynthesis glycosyltransferase
MKEFLFDRLIAFVFLLIFSPIILLFLFLIWAQDFYSPFYVAKRVGQNEKLFNMIKLRSMKKGADKSGVDSTSSNDQRITAVGHFIRRYKLDELSQLFNVVTGHMLLVGPRPNVKRETDLYTDQEKKILSVKPGITDLSSIVFADEGDILKNSKDPDIDYNQLIRPWKSRLCLFYIENRTLLMDIKILWFTVLTFLSRNKALQEIKALLLEKGADKKLVEVVERTKPLVPTPPPGSTEIVTTRENHG